MGWLVERAGRADVHSHSAGRSQTEPPSRLSDAAAELTCKNRATLAASDSALTHLLVFLLLSYRGFTRLTSDDMLNSAKNEEGVVRLLMIYRSR